MTIVNSTEKENNLEPFNNPDVHNQDSDQHIYLLNMSFFSLVRIPVKATDRHTLTHICVCVQAHVCVTEREISGYFDQNLYFFNKLKRNVYFLHLTSAIYLCYTSQQ